MCVAYALKTHVNMIHNKIQQQYFFIGRFED